MNRIDENARIERRLVMPSPDRFMLDDNSEVSIRRESEEAKHTPIRAWTQKNG